MGPFPLHQLVPTNPSSRPLRRSSTRMSQLLLAATLVPSPESSTTPLTTPSTTVVKPAWIPNISGSSRSSNPDLPSITPPTLLVLSETTLSTRTPQLTESGPLPPLLISTDLKNDDPIKI